VRLKIATTAFLVFGLLLVLGWPWLVGPRPPEGSPKQELAAYVTRLVFYLGGTLVVFFVTAVLAVLVLRRVREEFRQEAMRNLEELLEGVRRDHAKKEP